jgi:hypothetical protein
MNLFITAVRPEGSKGLAADNVAYFEYLESPSNPQGERREFDNLISIRAAL